MINGYPVLVDICEAFEMRSLGPQIEAINKIIDHPDFINVAVTGPFKSGKSSFINSLLSKPLLPTGITPVTNVVCIIRYGEREKAIIHKAGHQSEEIPVHTLDSYISEEKNPGNRQGLDYALIETPEMKAFKHLRLTDTPGLGSVFSHNSSATTDWLPNIGYSFVLTSATQPLSGNDLQLIEESINYSPGIIILISKTDLLSPDELEHVKQFIESTLSKKFNRPFRIFPYSIKKPDYKKLIIEEFLSPVNAGFDDSYHEVLTHKLRSLSRQCMDYLNIAEQSNLKKLEGENALKKQIISEQLNKARIERELNLIAGSYTEKIRDKMEEHVFGRYEQQVSAKLLTLFPIRYEAWQGNLDKLTRTFEQWCSQSILHELKICVDNDRSFFDGLENEAIAHLEQYLEFFRERLNENIFRVLGIKMTDEKWKIPLRETPRPDISISRTFDSHIDLLWFLFPMPVFKKVFFSYFKKQIPREVKKNLYRLTSKLTTAIDQEIKSARTEAGQYIANELSTLEKLLESQPGQLERIRQSIKKLESMNEG